MMFYSLWLLIFLYLVPLECKSEGYATSSNCTLVECPPYAVVHSQKEFEIRIYEEAIWVSGPDILDTSIESALPNTFLGLDAYYGGRNVGNVKIDKTAPIFIDIEPALYYVQNTTYRANYYLPKKYQNAGAPKPLSLEIKQVKFPKHKYAAVRRIESFFLDDSFFIAFTAFISKLKGTPYERAATFKEFTFAYNLNTIRRTATFNEVSVEGFNELLVWFD